MAIYLGYTLGKRAPVITGSFDDVIAWSNDVLLTHSVIKISRARSERASVKVIGDITSEGLNFVRTPRVLSHGESRKLCRKAREEQ